MYNRRAFCKVIVYSQHFCTTVVYLGRGAPCVPTDLFSPPNSPIRFVLSSPTYSLPFLDEETASERPSDLPRITQLLSSRVGIGLCTLWVQCLRS